MTAESPAMSGHWIAHDELRAAAVGPVARCDTAALGFDEALGDGEAEARAGAPAVAVVGPVELLEQPAESRLGDAGAFVAYDDLDLLLVQPRGNLDAGAGR